MKLSDFVAAYVPQDLRQQRDFTGARGWIYLMNRLLRRIEIEGIADINQRLETPVLNFDRADESFITLPSDLRRLESIYPYGHPTVFLPYDVINARVRLREKRDEPTLISAVSEGVVCGAAGPLSAPTTSDCWIAWTTVAYQANDSLNGMAVKFSLPASDVGVCRVIYDTVYSATIGNYLHIYWDPTLPAAPTYTTGYGYVYDKFLMMRYFQNYASVAAQGDEVPIDDRFEPALANGLNYMACEVLDKRYAAYKTAFEEDLSNLNKEQFSPTIEQGRPEGTDWPDFHGGDHHYYPRTTE
jgi:hypothetical protein